MKKKITVFFIIAFLSVFTLAQSQTSKVGTTSAQFLKIGVGARAVAMGEASVSRAEDASAVFWNPAGLAGIQQREVMFLHSNWLASMRFDFAGLTLPLGQNAGTFGFFATMLSTPEDAVRTVYMPEGTGETFQSIDLAAGLAYARMLTDKLDVGFNLKYIRQSIWKMHGSTWAIDFGSVYRTGFRNLKIGIAISNFGSPIAISGQSATLFVDPDPNFQGEYPAKAELQTEAWELPLTFRYGLSMDAIKSRSVRLTLASDLTHLSDMNNFANLGCEYAIREMVFLRGGYRGLGMSDLEGGLTAGAGFSVNIGDSCLRINYAYVNYGRLEATHRYDLTVVF